MSIFKNMNRKERRAFDKMPKEKKTEIIQAEVTSKISPVLSKQIAKSMINGMRLEKEQIYQKYVTKIEGMKKGSKSYYNEVEELLSYIRIGHVEWEKLKNKTESEQK